MSLDRPRTEFRGKTWMVVVTAVVVGDLAAFSLILGPLFLLEVMKDARGQPAPDAGLALTIMSIPLTAVFALSVFQIVARRRPQIRICREGLAINMIGCSALDDVPLVPTLVRVAWAIVSEQGFRQQVLYAPWSTLESVRVWGLPMARRLTIGGEMYRSAKMEQAELIARQVTFDESMFVVPLEQIAEAILEYGRRLGSRDELVSWIR